MNKKLGNVPVAERTQWLKGAIESLRAMPAILSSHELSGFMLSLVVMRSSRICLEVVDGCYVLWWQRVFGKGTYGSVNTFVLPKKGKGKPELYIAALSLLGQHVKVCAIPYADVAGALAQACRGTKQDHSCDYVASDLSFGNYEGGSWRSVRRSLRQPGMRTEVMPLSEAAKVIVPLEQEWLAYSASINKRIDAPVVRWEGQGVSQLVWWAQNHALLESLGAGVVAVGSFDTEGCYAVQLFCQQSARSFHCFGRRQIYARRTQHAIYEEMRLAGLHPSFAGMSMNDGEGYADENNPLNRMKARYCDQRATSYSIKPD